MSRKKFLLGLFVIVICILMLIIYQSDWNASSREYYSQVSIRNPNSVRILTMNVGNLSIGCLKYLNNLCYKSVENILIKEINSLNPDIVALQEILAPWQCKDGKKEKNPNKVCSDFLDTPQVRRLLGNEYTIVCDDINQFECIGVKVTFGNIKGCKLGNYCTNARTVSPIKSCDPGFTTSSVTVIPHMSSNFDVVNVHLQSTSTQCRTSALQSLFNQSIINPIISEDLILILGDFNFNPINENDISAEAFRKYINKGWGEKPLRYHFLLVNDKPEATAYILWIGKTYDFMVSNFLIGNTVVLEKSETNNRSFSKIGIDHRPVLGDLIIEE